MYKFLVIFLFVATSFAFAADNLPTMNAAELAKHNGKNGNKAYVAYKGKVYDVSNVKVWKNGKHEGNVAGTDLTENMPKSPHGEKILDEKNLKPVANYIP